MRHISPCIRRYAALGTQGEKNMYATDDELITLTQELVSIESTNPGTYEKNIGDFVYTWLKNAGAEVVRDEFAPGRFNVCSNIRGLTDAPSLAFVGHMDTVPVGDGWVEAPFGGKIREGKLYGRGAADMKSGLACFMLIYRDILKTGKKPKHTFTFVATADEENLMTGAQQALKSGWLTKDSWVLDAEPTGDKILIGHKGKTWFKITAMGIGGHASTPERCVDAVAAMGEIISEIRTRIALLPVHSIFGPCSATFGTIQGGSNINIVPDACTVHIDLRLVPPVSNEQTIELVQEAVAAGTAKVAGSSGTVEVLSKMPSVDIDFNAPILHELKTAYEQVLGKVPTVTFFPGYTDSGVVAAHTGNSNCLSYGPGALALAHVANEYVTCASVVEARKVLQKLAENILL